MTHNMTQVTSRLTINKTTEVTMSHGRARRRARSPIMRSEGLGRRRAASERPVQSMM